MLVRFTNAQDKLKGNPIYINCDQIVSVFEVPSAEGGSLMTVVFGGPVGSEWIVEESLEEAVRLIESAARPK